VPRAAALALALCLWAAPSVQAQTLDGVWEVTAYACPPYCGRTASGVQVGPQSIAAPSYVPFGTRLCIQGWGCGVVQDRGSAIVGRRLDVFLPSHAAAVQWGRRWVNVTAGSGAVSVNPPWQELVEEVTYLDVDAYVTRRTYDTNRGRIDTYEVHP
jgi:3D (Asp-Asp-Asp) domain-containing protein